MDYCLIVGPHARCKLPGTFTGWKMARFWTGGALYDVILTPTPLPSIVASCMADIFLMQYKKSRQFLHGGLFFYNMMRDCLRLMTWELNVVPYCGIWMKQSGCVRGR